MIRCALAEMRRLPTSILRRLSPSISPSSTAGSSTTPLPITQAFSECRIPEGIRWNLNSSPSRTIVWPALLPPWKRTITSARSASRSVTLPLPSSPHWAPTMTVPGTRLSVGCAGDFSVTANSEMNFHYQQQPPLAPPPPFEPDVDPDVQWKASRAVGALASVGLLLALWL